MGRRRTEMPVERSRGRVFGAALVLATFLAYLPALRCGFIWDDDKYVETNDTLRTAAGLGRIWTDPRANSQYYPLVFSSFWVEHHLWGLDPRGYHVVNVLLHGANAVLVWLVLERLGVPGARLAAAVFALHPVQVESVAWVTERKNVLSGLFFLLALRAFLTYRARGADAAGGKPSPPAPGSRKLYALSLLFFSCALLSKSVTATLPAVLLLVGWWRSGRIRPRDLLETAPFFAIGGALAAHTAWLEADHVGASGAAWSFSPLERVLIAARALWFYAAKLVWPDPLTFIYPRWSIDAGAWWQYLFPLSAALLFVALWWWRGRIGRGPLAATTYFAVVLAPALGFVDFYPMLFSFVADHFQYLASLGPIAGAAALAARVTGRPTAASAPSQPVPARLLAGALLLALGTLTWRQTGLYRDAETLWRDTLAKNPKAWIAHNNLGAILYQRGELAAAEAAYGEVVRLNPSYAMGFYNRGTALQRLGRVEEGVADYRRALELREAYPEVHSNLAAALVSLGRNEEALAHLERAARLDPRNPVILFNLGELREMLGRIPEARDAYRQALALKPDYEEARQRLRLLGRQ